MQLCTWLSLAFIVIWAGMLQTDISNLATLFTVNGAVDPVSPGRLHSVLAHTAYFHCGSRPGLWGGNHRALHIVVW